MDSRRGDAQGPALLILFPNSSLAELRACLPLRVLTLTRLFSAHSARSEPPSSPDQVCAGDKCRERWGHHELETVLAQAPDDEESFGLGPEQAASLRKPPHRFGGLPLSREIDTKRN